MTLRRMVQYLLFIACFYALGINGCGSGHVCKNDVSNLTIDPNGSPCSERCECNNQLFHGFCNDQGVCEAYTRKDCTEPGETQSCTLLKPDIKEGCDQGQQTCQPEELTLKKWGDCRPITRTQAENTPELCFDALDNDCDGKFDKFDEDCASFCQPDTTRPCYSGPDSARNKGICKLGTQTCNKDGKGYGPCQDEILPKQEECNGEDDDCDGQVDENPEGCKCDKAGETGPCYGGPADTLNKGICTSGLRTCVQQKEGLLWGPCSGDITPQVENCDGIDNDCNDKVDDAKQCNPCGLPGTTQPCFTGKLHQRNRGICRDGTQTCGADGLWSKCTQQVLPDAQHLDTGTSCDPTAFDSSCEEVKCDGQDNDCDGIVDETCPLRACDTDADCQLIPSSKGVFTCQLNRCVPKT
ncbi:MAG: hypothetical protein CL920_15800 [Deltaproteobacteria bacterium]|nr:hypothetical protein [Deltaproteobacteria bacterium]